MVKEKSWEEFKKSGLLWFVNRTLHVFGWSIVFEYKENQFIRAYPARVKFRGFDSETESEGYVKVSEYLKDNIEDLAKEAKE